LQEKIMRLTIRMKMLIVFMSIFTVFLLGTFYWFYQFSTARMMDELRQSLVVSASTAAGMVDADEFVREFESGTEGDAGYEKIAQSLRIVRDANPRAAAVYTAVKSTSGNPTELMFVVTAEEDPNDRAHLRDTYDASNSPEMIDGFDAPIADTEMGGDEYGNWFSGYAPILDKDGKTVGIVGVDMTADEVIQNQNHIAKVSLFVFFIAFVSVFIAVILISGAITRPLKQITDAARVLENDQPYDPKSLEKLEHSKDELGLLAHVFNGMAVQIQERAEKLKREVIELRIEIDQTKKQKQVSEIVDSEYFQTLKDKSNTLRKRRSGEGKE
jgi:methyl-accepting chemotaxis protein